MKTTMLQRFKNLLAKWLWLFQNNHAINRFIDYGNCPECDSDEPKKHYCKVCGDGKVPRQFILRNFFHKNKYPGSLQDAHKYYKR